MIARSLIALGAFVLMSAPAFAQMPAPPDPWTPPLGIPAPPFGIVEKAGAVTHYVDSTHRAATDASNPNGTKAKPRKTVPLTLPAGSVVELRGGPYAGLKVTAEGTEAAPVFIKGVGDPVIEKGGATTRGPVTIAGSYFIMEGVIFDGTQLMLDAALSHFALRRSQVRNFNPPRNTAAIGVGGSHIVIFANEIHHNGDSEGAVEIDVHGIKPDTGDEHLWVIDNHIHHNGGDSVQIGNANSKEPWVHHVYVARNQLHDDRENAVDIKRARDIVVSQNTMYGYEKTNTSGGVVAVAHNMPERVWFLNNVMRDSQSGLVSTGAKEFYAIGNVIYNIRHADAPDYNPSSLFGSHAILVYSTTDAYVIGNTVWNVSAGISYASGAAKVELVNNIVGNVTQPSHHLAVGNSGAARASVSSNNLLFGKVLVRWGKAASSDLSSCRKCKTGDPGFANPEAGDFRPSARSPAAGNGVRHEAFKTFQALYGLSIDTDINGVARPAGTWSIGAAESGGAPTVASKP